MSSVDQLDNLLHLHITVRILVRVNCGSGGGLTAIHCMQICMYVYTVHDTNE